MRTSRSGVRAVVDDAVAIVRIPVVADDLVKAVGAGRRQRLRRRALAVRSKSTTLAGVLSASATIVCTCAQRKTGQRFGWIGRSSSAASPGPASNEKGHVNDVVEGNPPSYLDRAVLPESLRAPTDRLLNELPLLRRRASELHPD